LGIDWSSLSGADRAAFRRRHVGLVIQGFSMLPHATAAENVEVPLLLDGVPLAERRRRVAQALTRVGLENDAAKLPDQLSCGQQQRVAIARARVNEPDIVLADEPTGSLDSATATTVIDLLVDGSRKNGAAALIVTHDPMVAARADRIVRLRSGRLDAPN